MKIDELKSELEIIRKGCGDGRYEDNCGDEYPDDDGTPFKVYCPTCKAKIEYLKKGISACEEIINQSQHKTKPLEDSSCCNSELNKNSVLIDAKRTNRVDTQESKQGNSPVQTLIKEMSHYKSKCVDLMCENDELEKKRAYWEMRCKQEQDKIKQALSQRNQEIRANIDKLFIEYRRLGWGLGDVWEDVIKQLTNSEGENV